MPTDAAITTAAMATAAPAPGLLGRQLRPPRLDLTEHRRGTHGVAVAQRGVVGVVDVAGVVLALEVGERTQQEPALLLAVRRADRDRPGSRCYSCRRPRKRRMASATSSRSASVGSAVAAASRFHRRNTTVSPATPHTRHHRRQHPDQRVESRRSWHQQHLGAVPVSMKAMMSSSPRSLLGHEFGDLAADGARRVVLRHEHALAVTDRASDALARWHRRGPPASAGPVDRNAPTARNPATTNTSAAHPGQRFTALFHSRALIRCTARGTAAGSCRVARR